ncbi:MAG: extracellular solute-binding protein [Phycisphaeraceae bacterium]|nr:extracellular solute-binding protein [Phycisphaeraceae bacterium]
MSSAINRLKERMESFTAFGLAPAVLLVLTLISGVYIAFNPAQTIRGDLALWIFAKGHLAGYQESIARFEEMHPDLTVEIQLVHQHAITSRLRAALAANLDVPDLVEIEISWAGSFFRGPVDDVSFMDLRPWLEESGYIDKIVRTRFAPYSVGDRIFGIPHDVHPVMLAYRRDIFEAEGIDVDEIETWDQFIEIGKRLTRRGGTNPRYMIGLDPNSSDSFEVLLFQRGGAYFNERGELTIDDELVVQTLLWFIPLVAGPDRIGVNPGWGAPFARAVLDGYILCYITPDWRTKIIENDVGDASGKMALMPLPAFEPGGRRTSTWGGTMLGITRGTENPEKALELAEHLYLNHELLLEMFQKSNILPPLRDLWDDPVFDQPREFWSGQPLGRLYADLADDVPPQYSSPYVSITKAKMGQVISGLTAHYNRHGEDGFEEQVRQRLNEAADYVRGQMARNPF